MAQPTAAGQMVQDNVGDIGITTEYPRTNGSRSGQVPVMFIGERYPTWYETNLLTCITIAKVA